MDNFSYHCGVIDAFSEVVKAGVKKLALSHPFETREDALEVEEFVMTVCNDYKIKYYLEDSLLISDLFPKVANINKVVYLLFKDDEILNQYLFLKDFKLKSIKNGDYHMTRKDIAVSFGKLLSYSDNMIESYIQSNNDIEA